ncbi:MAG: prepilin-type N-terminal cleavage/methylation domain-containing protein [Hahellaceae bacterium]|nr:prepilin-type N-terminal cleavage/methylation domain-containing protein [Hahellaceae bacterium]
MQHKRGFTLIELMVVVAVIGILAAIAYPAYTNNVRKSNRAEAKAAIMEAAARQEKLFAQSFSYARDMTSLGYSANPFVTDNGKYSVAVTNPSSAASPAAATTFTLTATALGAQTDDSCDGFSITHIGTKGVSEGTVDLCW